MSLVGLYFKLTAARDDVKRDKYLKEATDLVICKNLSYTGNQKKYELLDVYYPKSTSDKLPTIMNIHGGGWVYGTKENYKFYCMYLAQMGFAVVNMNYYLAPRKRFPSQLIQINQALEWIESNDSVYPFDLNNMFLVGDSAGAQLVSHYAAIYTNPSFAKVFPFTPPHKTKIRAVGLNCGIYELSLTGKTQDGITPSGICAKFSGMNLMGGLIRDYLGRYGEEIAPMLDVKSNITESFPPAYIMTAYYDFLQHEARPMYELLRSRGVDAEYKLYGTKADKHMQHVCHVDMNIPQAFQMNQDELNFFIRHIV